MSLKAGPPTCLVLHPVPQETPGLSEEQVWIPLPAPERIMFVLPDTLMWELGTSVNPVFVPQTLQRLPALPLWQNWRDLAQAKAAATCSLLARLCSAGDLGLRPSLPFPACALCGCYLICLIILTCKMEIMTPIFKMCPESQIR